METKNGTGVSKYVHNTHTSDIARRWQPSKPEVGHHIHILNSGNYNIVNVGQYRQYHVQTCSAWSQMWGQPLVFLVAVILNSSSLLSSINDSQRHAVFSVSSQSRSRPWSRGWMRLIASPSAIPFKSCFQFRFGGRHLQSVVNNMGIVIFS